MQITGQFAQFLTQLGPFEPSPSLAVALSGGPDSMALALLADHWVKAQGGRIVALTVDHRLRPESTDEAQRVAGWMRERGIEHHILTPRHTPAGNNVMQAARDWRYHALSEWCREQHVLHCLLGHQLGDQLETMLMHRQRGAGTDGDAGMSTIRLYRGVRFLRPLLALEKEELLAFLGQQQAPWVEDPTNRREEFTRTRTRHQMADAEDLPMLVRSMEAEAAARMQRDAAQADAAMRLVCVHPSGYATLDLNGWRALPAESASQLLADIIVTVGGHVHRPRQHETAWLMQALQLASGQQTLGHCLLTWDKTTLTVAREPAWTQPPVALQGSGMLLWDRRFRVRYRLDTPLTLGALGLVGRKQLKKARVAEASGLPLSTPALWHLDDLYAVPHIGWSAAGSAPQPLVQVGFAPAKPLAAQGFWWFTGA
jgi:tRNA(Ile)-lysidine synthase